MHVLRVISSMNHAAGGPCRGIRNSIPAVAKLGVTTEVVSCDAPDADWLGSDSFTIHALGSGRYGYAYSPRLLPWLIENLPRFDAVIIHGLWLWPSIATRIALTKLNRIRFRQNEQNLQNGASYPEYPETGVPKSETSKRDQHPNHSDNSVNSVKKLPRCFVMPHGMLDPYFQRAPERRLKAIRNWIYWKLVEHRVVNNADGLLFTCEEEMRLAREPFRPYRPKREIVVKYGTPEPPPYTPAMRDAFAAACPNLGDQPYILFLGRIHPKKGVDMLIRAYARIKAAATDAEHRPGKPTGKLKAETISQVSDLKSQVSFPALVIAGPCHDPEYLRKLKAETGASAHGNARGSLLGKAAQRATLAGAREATLKPESGIQPAAQTGGTGLSGESSVEIGEICGSKIHFVDMLSGDAKWGALYGCEAFILPSHQENFGIAVAEALACNKPVLISNKVNIWREIEADGAGIVEDDTDEGTENLLRRFCNEWRVTSSESNPPDTGNPPPATPYTCFKQRFSIEQATESFLREISR